MLENAKTLMLAALTVAPLATAYAEETRSGLEDQTAIAVTIYNENLALVRDQRKVVLEPGEQDLAIRDVSARIRPETALVTSLDQAVGWRLLEQNFDYDLLTPDSLLNKYVGQQVEAVSINSATGNETVETAEVLATNDGVVLKFSDRIETNFPGRLIFNQVPDNLRDRPTLVLKVENSLATPQNIQLSYLTAGLSWRADYVASLNDDETAMDLNGWVTLHNNSGTTYPSALLQLVAGEVNQVQRVLPRASGLVTLASVSEADAVAEEALFDYHLYTLPRPTTIADKQTKQVALMSAGDVPVKKQYVTTGFGHLFDGPTSVTQKQDVAVLLMLRNNSDSHLGVPMPAGVMRVYKNDSANRIQFIGEDRIDHTPRDEGISLKLGNAFDITVERKQSAFKKVQSKGQYRFSAEVSQIIVVRNAKEQPVEVILREHIPGDWEIVDESDEHEKVSSSLAEWRVSMAPGEEARLEYTALVRY